MWILELITINKNWIYFVSEGNLLCPNLPVLRIHQFAADQSYSADKCDHCGKTFERRGRLEIHQKKYCYWNPLSEKFGNSKSYTCNFCGAGYSHKYTLNAHIRNDCGRIHGCDVCGTTFQNLRNLLRHKASESCQRSLSKRKWKF